MSSVSEKLQRKSLRFFNMSSYFWFLLLLTVTAATSSECPQDCTCSPIHNQQTPQHNHAKCSTLNNIKENMSYPNVHSLDLSSTNLESIPIELESLQNVTHLDLSNNRLATLTKLNNRIRSLDLSHNRLTSTELVKISPKIRILNLSFNEITYLPLDVMNFKSLKSINLIGNRIDCSCETITVRDWLHRNNVWMSKHTICASPLENRHQPWDKISKNEICSIYGLTEDVNKIQIRNSRELDLSDFIAEEFLPFDSHSILKRQVPDYDNLNDDVDGSGNDEQIAPPESVIESGSGEGSGEGNVNENSGENSSLAIDDYEEEEIEESEGSGSGAGILPIIGISAHDGGEENHTTEEPDVEGDEADEVTFASVKLNIFGAGVRVADVTTVAPTETVHIPVGEEIKQTEQNSNENEVVVDPNNVLHDKDDLKMSEDPKKGEESSSTFILLAILGILLVSLIVYVVFKRRKNRSRSSYNNNDAENVREIEMLDMKKNSNGKHENVEIVPLMPKKEQPKIEKGLGDQNKEINSNIQPLHTTNYPKIDSVPTKQNDVPQPTTTTALPENNNNLSQIQQPEQQPSKEIPKTVDEMDDNATSKPSQNGHNGHMSDDEEVFLPEESTVKRYSPVYSPETGRVKIKLTETPKPKTPMLVTRSRSNAGAYITTPNLNIRSTSANGQ